MAKIRVYELARSLNITNKVLLEKMRNMGVSVKSHMGSVDDEIAEKIKSSLFGEKPKEVDVVRVKPTVIRRRKKKVIAEEPAIVEEKPATAEEIAEPEEKPDTTAEEIAEPEEPAIVETVEPEEEAAKPDVIEPEKTLKKDKAVDIAPEKTEIKKPVHKRAVKRKKKDTPAKIIKLAVPPPALQKIKEKPESAKKAFKAKDKSRAPIAKKQGSVEKVEPTLTSKQKKEKKTGVSKEDVKDKRFVKKKISFRKKEIVEGRELYAGSSKGRKPRRGRKGKKVSTVGQKTQITTPKAIKRRIKIDETIVLSELSKRMGVKANEVIKKLIGLGVMATVNQQLGFDTAVIVASEFDYEVEKVAFEEKNIITVQEDEPGKLISRPPVVTIMGHVDHGKTSLLDVIRKTKITEAEAGGITQHIGAYNVSTGKGQIIFLDTPGHEAFTAMRARGADVTDIVVLVVAADDGVMPQTIEAINHANAAEVPIIVAINKIDKQNAEPDRVQRELSEAGLVPEDWGGDTIFLKVSAKMNKGIDELLDMILLQTELLELKANPDKLAKGYVVEAKLDPGKGSVATVLIQEGTLHVGEPVVCGVHYGKIRAIISDKGKNLDSAKPSIPVEIIGLTGVPNAGDELVALNSEKDAKEISSHRIVNHRTKELSKSSRLSLENLYSQLKEGDVKDFHIIIKADVHGSIEALKESLIKLSNNEVKINVIHSATGAITESDVSLAAVSDATIIGFNVRAAAKVSGLAKDENIEIRYYSIIYDVIKDVKNSIVGLMASTFKEELLGSAEVRDVFHVPKIGAIAGCFVTDGKIERGRKARLVRDGNVIYDGKISSLRRFQDDVKEVQNGYECGIGLENYNDIKNGDIIECYFMIEIKPELE